MKKILVTNQFKRRLITSDTVANVRYVSKNAFTYELSKSPVSEAKASMSRWTVPYLMTRTSSSLHCNHALFKASAYFNAHTTA